jgi:hypothetical protein
MLPVETAQHLQWHKFMQACVCFLRGFSVPWFIIVRSVVPVYKCTHAVLCGCETRSVTLREERWLRVLQNKILTKISGSKRLGATGGYRNVHIEEFHKLYLCQMLLVYVLYLIIGIYIIYNIIRRWDVQGSRETRHACTILGGKLEGLSPYMYMGG